MMSRLLFTLAVLASCACGAVNPVAPEATPLTTAKGKVAACTFTLSTDVKGFTSGTVAKAMLGPECDPLVLPSWELLTNPDGVTYTLHDSHADLLNGVAGAVRGHGKYVRLHSWIHGDRVRFLVTLEGVSLEVMLAPQVVGVR